MASSSILASIPKLKGRENFATWKFAIENYMEFSELSDCLTGTETDAKKISKAKTQLIMAIDPVNFIHVQKVKTAKEAWDNLKSAFEDKGLARRIGLIRNMVTTKLEECSSTEDYVNRIVSNAHKLFEIGFEIDDEWIGTFLLAGLTEKYDPMIMGLESSGTKLSSDLIKTKLLQDVADNGGDGAFFNRCAKPKSSGEPKRSKNIRCFKCNENGHIASQFTSGNEKKDDDSKKVEGTTMFVTAAFINTACVSGSFSDSEWYADSGASMHMVSNENLLVNNRNADIDEIVAANNQKMKVKCSGDVKLKVNGKVRSEIIVRNVQCVPQLMTNLISVSQVVRNGNGIVFDKHGCEIFNTNGELVLTGKLVNNMYRLDIESIGAKRIEEKKFRVDRNFAKPKNVAQDDSEQCSFFPLCEIDRDDEVNEGDVAGANERSDQSVLESASASEQAEAVVNASVNVSTVTLDDTDEYSEFDDTTADPDYKPPGERNPFFKIF